MQENTAATAAAESARMAAHYQQRMNAAVMAYVQTIREHPDMNPVNEELEVRVQRKSRVFDRDVPIGASDKEAVKEWLLARGFRAVAMEGQQMMRVILPEKNIRLELIGVDAIQQYCRKDEDLNAALSDPRFHDKILFTEKSRAVSPIDGAVIEDFFHDDMNLKVSYKREQQIPAARVFSTGAATTEATATATTADSIPTTSPFATATMQQLQQIFHSWRDHRKLYRFMNRATFTHPSLPVKVDISVVKSSKTRVGSGGGGGGGDLVPEKTFRASGVFTNPESFEIEIEVDGARVKKMLLGTPAAANVEDIATRLVSSIRRAIGIVLSGLQGSGFPVGNAEKQHVLDTYMQMISEKAILSASAAAANANAAAVGNKSPIRFLFIGPSPITLQLSNIRELPQQIPMPSSSSSHPADATVAAAVAATTTTAVAANIRSEYTVTEKADGTRKLLFVCGRQKLKKTTDTHADGSDGTDARPRVYLLDGNGEVTFTGTTVRPIYNLTILDGELVCGNNNNTTNNNSYLAFDAYFLANEMVMQLPLFDVALDDDNEDNGDNNDGDGDNDGQERSVYFRGGGGGKKKKRTRRPPTKRQPPPRKKPNNININNDDDDDDDDENVVVRSRYSIVREIVADMVASTTLVSMFAPPETNIHFRYKHYLYASGEVDDRSIFDQAREIWVHRREKFPYAVDGLVFTPAQLAVHGTDIDYAPREVFHKKPWSHLLKWKPADSNTIDFFVSFASSTTTTTTTTTTDIAAAATAATAADNDDPSCSDDSSQLCRVADVQYQCVELKCGANTNIFNGGGDYNPWQMMMYGVPPDSTSAINRNYHAVPFVPIDPPNLYAYRCFLPRAPATAVDGNIYTTVDREVIRDGFVVEFAYDKSRPPGFGWIPLRLRHDKMGERSFGNSFRTANDNWYSIHHEVTAEMIVSGKNIPRETASPSALSLLTAGSEGVDQIVDFFEYYSSPAAAPPAAAAAMLSAAANAAGNGTSSSPTMGVRSQSPTFRLRNFHNLVKSWLLGKCVESKSAPATLSLIDLAMGKGGDVCKWMKLPIKFVLGIDASPQNIYGLDDGACQRYLRMKRILESKNNNYAAASGAHPSQPSSLFDAAFLVGDASKNIRESQEAVSAPWLIASASASASASAATDTENSRYRDARERNRLILRSVFHSATTFSPAEKQWIPPATVEAAISGFDICSCQFALHYFCKDISTFHGFLRNVAECTKTKGFFVGACLDGDKIYQLLRQRHKDDDTATAAAAAEYTITNDEGMILFRAKKMYSDDRVDCTSTLPANEFSLGMAINVYQESIGKCFTEYLVNFDFLATELAKYGFEAVESGGGSSGGDFESMFAARTELVRECHSDDSSEQSMRVLRSIEMTAAERKLSFLNRAFLFQKMRDPAGGKTPADISAACIQESMLRLQNPIVSVVSE